ncbi:hypothetical protein [Kitasatospora sp. NPDC059673]|uniref:hypothetical protein n=1 Tax=Kitasatospora sp. NPDC059673 TaxID=3346901 RepID=UPI0036BED622
MGPAGPARRRAGRLPGVSAVPERLWSVLIKGYGLGPLVVGERLLERAGFWSNHLLPWCRCAPGEVRAVPEWFGDDGADTDALSEVLLEERAWPTFRVPFGGGHSAVVVHRNLLGDYGVDYLRTHPDWPRAEDLSSYDGDWSGPGLSWHDIVHIAETPDLAAPGVHDTEARLLLLLPLLAEDELPPEASARVSAALADVGASEGSVQEAAGRLLRNRRPKARRAESPLSGGSCHIGPGSDESAVLWALGLTRSQSDALAGALGSGLLPASPQ